MAFGLGILEMLQKHLGIGLIEVPAAVFLFGLAEHIAIGQRDRGVRVVVRHVHHMIDAQHIHRQTLQPIGQLARDRVAIMPADLLEIGELAHLHPVAPNLPSKAPSAKGRAFPVILDKADVMQGHVDADCLKRPKIERLQIRRAGFDQHLILVVMLKPVRVLAIAPIRRAARGLDIGGSPRLCAKAAQRRGRVERARADLHVIGLHHRTALSRPIGHQPQDDFLKTARSGECGVHVKSSVGCRALHRQKPPKGQCAAGADLALTQRAFQPPHR